MAWALLFGGQARAQQAPTLEAVRLRRPEAIELARADLARCAQANARLAASPPDAGAVGCDATPRLSLLVGYLLLTSGEAKEAARQLSTHPAPLQLAAFHAFYLGQAQFYSGEPAAAARSFEKAERHSPAWLKGAVRARLGEALLAAGDPVRAGPLLERAAPERATAELYHQRAIARRALGNLDGERADLRTLVLRFPAHPYGRAAFDRLLSAKGKPFALSFEERLSRSRGFLASGEARAALEELDQAAKQKLARGASAKARLAYARSLAHFALGEEAEGERQLDLALKGQASVASEALMLRARRALKVDNRKARGLLAELDSRFPREPAAADAGFLVGWLDLQAGRYADAVRAFELFEKRHGGSRKRDEAAWFKALSLLELESWAEAAAALEALCADFPRSSLVPQARYWAIRAGQLEAKGKDGEELAFEYEAVVAQFPGSFYSLLASERLRELGREPKAAFPEPPRQLDTEPPKELALALALRSAGLLRDWAEETQARLSQVRSAEQALRFGHALQSLGEYGYAHALAARLLWGAAYGAKEPFALALMYPRAFRPGVEKWAQQNGLDPYLIWAVMRRESAFRPEVASAADARGLMQVIPPTAEAIARETNEEVPSPEELFAPEVNLRLASWYLSALRRRFGHPALAVAAYNAGPGPVVKWANERAELPLDLWVEEIPYKETRGYVKQVVADYFVYRSLYGEPPERISLAVPRPGEGVDF
ncbi:MAG: transglycosylase SLT domain-containing protein [Myxococcales bacterium]|nr:transglycosylase SLT domain-containing protein [Myxococcales bacterium]